MYYIAKTAAVFASLARSVCLIFCASLAASAYSKIWNTPTHTYTHTVCMCMYVHITHALKEAVAAAQPFSFWQRLCPGSSTRVWWRAPAPALPAGTWSAFWEECVCVWERERERERQVPRDTETYTRKTNLWSALNMLPTFGRRLI
jgi:hypothetical protein